MEVTITLIICLSVVFIITLGIISCTLRDKNFKVRFDDRNKRLSRLFKSSVMNLSNTERLSRKMMPI